MTNATKKAELTTSKPVNKLRIGLMYATVWQRITGEGTFYSVSFERRYRDSEGNWKSTHSYNAEDLLALAKLADRAHTEISNFRAAGSR